MKPWTRVRTAGRDRIVRARAGAALLLFLSTACGGSTDPTDPPANAPGRQVANEGWQHVTEGSPITYRSNPPASGSHYPVWARYEEFSVVVPRGYWVHTLEHGAVVFLYRPDAPAATVTALRDAFRSLPNDPACGSRRALLTIDPDMPRPVAVVAADWILEDTVDAAAIRAFAAAHQGRGPENVCTNGSRP